MKTSYEHLGESERRRVERLRAAGWGVRSIARALGRGVATVSDEIRRNSVNGRYVARKAEHKAYVARKYSKVQCLKVVTNKNLRNFVEEKIVADWSPEAISGRIEKIEKRLPDISAKAIYKFVHSVHGRRIEKHLYSKAVKRRSGPKRRRSIWKDGRVSIERRPKRVERRQQFGHFEADFIESGRDGKGSLLVVVERKTRYPFLVYTQQRDTERINRTIFETLRGAPIKSVTVDNDISLQKHKELSALLKSDIFFCHPFSSWEKGTVENRNRAIRRYVPKRSDLSQFQDKFEGVERKLRSRPMKCLNWRTPEEVWLKEMRKYQNKKDALGACVMMSRVLKVNQEVFGLRG